MLFNGGNSSGNHWVSQLGKGSLYTSLDPNFPKTVCAPTIPSPRPPQLGSTHQARLRLGASHPQDAVCSCLGSRG